MQYQYTVIVHGCVDIVCYMFIMRFRQRRRRRRCRAVPASLVISRARQMAGGGSAAVVRRTVGDPGARRGYRQDAVGGRRTSDTTTGVRCTTHTGTVQDACAAGRGATNPTVALFSSP